MTAKSSTFHFDVSLLLGRFSLFTGQPDYWISFPVSDREPIRSRRQMRTKRADKLQLRENRKWSSRRLLSWQKWSLCSWIWSHWCWFLWKSGALKCKWHWIPNPLVLFISHKTIESLQNEYQAFQNNSMRCDQCYDIFHSSHFKSALRMTWYGYKSYLLESCRLVPSLSTKRSQLGFKLADKLRKPQQD